MTEEVKMKAFKMHYVLFIIPLVFFACELQSITIKGTPSFTLPAGTITVPVTDILNADTFTTQLSGGFDGLTVDTTPGIYTLKLKKEIMNVGLKDFFSSSVPLTQSVSQDVPLKTFTIPTVDSSGIQAIVIPPIDGTVNNIPPITIPLGSANAFTSMTVGTGNITINLDTFGSTVDITMVLKQNTIELVNSMKTVDTTITQAVFPLDTVAFGVGDVTAEFSLNVTNTDGTFHSTDLNWSLAVTSITEVVMPSPDLDFSVDANLPIDPTVQSLVQKITMGTGSQMVMTMTNNLPFDIALTIESAPFGIDAPGDTRLFTKNSGTAQIETVDLTNKDVSNQIQPINITSLAGGILPFKITSSVPDYNATDKTLTLKSTMEPLVPGTTYSFSGKVEMTVIPTQITLNSYTIGPFDFPESPAVPLDFSGLNAVFPADVNFESIPMNIELAGLGPNVTGSVFLKGTYKTLSTDVTENTIDIIHDPSVTTAPLDFDGSSVTNGVLKLGGDFAGILNARPQSLILNYEVTIVGATISLDAASPPNLTAGFSLDLPLAFTTPVDPTTTDVLGDAGYVPGVELSLGTTNPLDFSGKDLFGRTNKTGPINQFLDQAGSVTLTMNVTEVPASGLVALMTVPDPFDPLGSPPLFAKEFALTLGDHVLNLSAADIELMKEVNFSPQIKFYLAYQDTANPRVQINYGQNFIANMVLNLETDINYKGIK